MYTIYVSIFVVLFQIFKMLKENISDLKSCVVHIPDPRTEDYGKVVDVREGSEVGVGRENFILRHAGAGLRVFILITSLSSLSPPH